MTDKDLTHLNARGEAEMVDIAGKHITSRVAVAQSKVSMPKPVLEAISNSEIAKGDVFACARIAGIQAAKKCHELIPLCHPLMLSKVGITLDIDWDNLCVVVQAHCKVDGKTGVEMEALTAASVAALTIYDMCKALEKGIVIKDTRLLTKSGGKSGTWSADT